MTNCQSINPATQSVGVFQNGEWGLGVLSFSIPFHHPFPFISRSNIFARPEFCIFFALSMFMCMRMADQVDRTDANFVERLSQAVRTDANLFQTVSERSGTENRSETENR